VRIQDDQKSIETYIKENWKLKDPKLILSILNSKIQSKENKEVYIEGLVKVAMDTGNIIYIYIYN
jgi:hypothetical protein